MKNLQSNSGSAKSKNRNLVIGILALAAIVIIVFLLLRKAPESANAPGGVSYPVAGGAGTAAAEEACLSNFKQIALAVIMFAAEHNNTLPKTDHWVDEVIPFVKDASVFKCPDDKSGARSSYAMNAALSGRPLSSLRNPGNVVLIFETDKPGDNPSGGPTSVLKNPRHPGGIEYGYADGHAGVSKEAQNFDPNK